MNKTRYMMIAATLIATVAVGSLGDPSSMDSANERSLNKTNE